MQKSRKTPPGLSEDALQALFGRWGVVPESAHPIEDATLLPPSLERVVERLRTEQRWFAWESESSVRFVVTELKVIGAPDDVHTLVEAWFFDDSDMVASATWQRLAHGAWQLVEIGDGASERNGTSAGVNRRV